MKATLVKLGASGAAISIWTPPLASAATLPNANVNNLQGFVNLICTIAGWLFAFLIVLAIVFILIAAFYYLTASDNAQRRSAANYMIVFAAVAIALGILARSLPFLVSSLVGGTFNGCP